METLEAQGVMWDSQTYGGGDVEDGAAHPHVIETSPSHCEQVRELAPTFGRAGSLARWPAGQLASLLAG